MTTFTHQQWAEAILGMPAEPAPLGRLEEITGKFFDRPQSGGVKTPCMACGCATWINQRLLVDQPGRAVACHLCHAERPFDLAQVYHDYYGILVTDPPSRVDPDAR